MEYVWNVAFNIIQRSVNISRTLLVMRVNWMYNSCVHKLKPVLQEIMCSVISHIGQLHKSLQL